MKILVVGAGYVGLVTAACLSSAENAVVCVDTDPSKIARLRQGVIPIYEPGLKEVVDESAKAGRLQFAEGISAGLALLESLPGDVPDLLHRVSIGGGGGALACQDLIAAEPSL